jgi:hypothetical protein
MSVLWKELILVSGLFDADWYRTFYSDVAGPASTRSPTTCRSVAGKGAIRVAGSMPIFIVQYPEVAEAGINSLIHYPHFRLSEGRQIRSLERNRECELISRSGFFSEDWHLSNCQTTPMLRFPALTQLNTFSILRHRNFAIPAHYSAPNITLQSILGSPGRGAIRLFITPRASPAAPENP